MPMTLDGSCQCGGVRFTLQSHTPVPYQLCACSICRKVGGYSGSVNLGGLSETLQIHDDGETLVKKYNATCVAARVAQGKEKEERSSGAKRKKLSSERAFCAECSTMLWVYDAAYPDLIHPFASAIDTELPVPDEMVCIRADSKPDW
ncbi:MAG: hypothetical protein M1838_004591, partial [Thelocarpon superellum]